MLSECQGFYTLSMISMAFIFSMSLVLLNKIALTHDTFIISTSCYLVGCRYFTPYLFPFTFFMIMLATSSNFSLDGGAGLVSYLLVNLWSIGVQTNKSVVKAIVFSQLEKFCVDSGDAFLLSIFPIQQMS